MYDKDFGGPDFGSGDGLGDNQVQGFNVPNIDTGAMRDMAGDAANAGANMGKKILPIAIILIILLAVGFFVFTYVGSQKDVTIELQDIDGNPVSGRITSFKDPALKAVPTSPKEGPETTFNAKVFPGDHKISVSATGYKPVSNKTLTITSDKTSYPVTLTRDISASFDIQLPAEIFEGQSVAGKLVVQNNGGEFNTSDITPTVTGPIEVKMELSGSDIIATGGAVSLDFNMKTKAGTAITAGQKVSVTFKVNGSEVTSEKVELSAFPGVKTTEVTVSGVEKLGETKAIGLTAGTDLQVKITIKNANKKAPLKNLRIEIVPDSESSATSEWIRFAEPSAESRLVKTADELLPNTTLTVTVFVEPPIESKIGDSFQGSFKINALSMNGEVSKVMNLEVTKEIKALLNLVITPQNPSITCKTSDSICTTLQYRNVSGTPTAYLENVGDITILKPINIAIDVSDPTTSTLCTSWISTFNPDSGMPDGAGGYNIQKDLTAKGTTGSKTSVEMDITSVITDESTQITCPIKYTFTDPTTDLVKTSKLSMTIKRTISTS